MVWQESRKWSDYSPRDYVLNRYLIRVSIEVCFVFAGGGGAGREGKQKSEQEETLTLQFLALLGILKRVHQNHPKSF